MSTRKKSKDPGRRRASLAGDVRDKERAPAATSSMGRTGQKGDLPSAIAKRAAAQLPGTQREGKNQGRRRSLRNNTAQSVVSDSGAASNAGLAGASQRSAKELIVSGEQTGLRKRTSVTERDFAMEQPGSSKESMKTPHAGAMERRGEAAHDGITEEPAQTGHAVIMKQSGVVVPTGPTFQPVASQSAGAVAETGNTELLAPSTQSGFTGPLAKSHSLRRGSQKSRDSFISTTSQAANVTEDVEWDGDEATNSQSMAIDYPERQSLHPTGPLYGKTLTPKASSPSSFTRETLKALSTLLCSHSPTGSTQVFDTLVLSCPCKPRTPGLFTLKNIDKVSSIPIAKHVQDTSNLVLGIKPPVTSDDLILLSDLSLLTGVFRLIDTLNDRDVVRHLSWLFVQAYGAVADPAAVLLLLHGSKLYAERQRPLFCASQVEASYQLLVAALTSVASFSPEQRRFIEAHLVAIVETFGIGNEQVSSTRKPLTNISASHKTVPTDVRKKPMKLEEAYENFPESAASFIEYWIETRRRQRALFGTDAAAEELLVSSSKALPYARYTHVLNQLSMPLGALALPLYCPEGTKGMLHGGLLYLYAQALVGALDSDGVRAFEQRTFGCLPNSGNIFPEIPAMEVAYASFKRQHQRNDSQLSEDLTEEKVFFITACMITCATTPADNVYGGDCNKAVMNFAPFAEAFQCAPGSNMNPKRKCTFFD
ncbi:hypothetical protein HPB51_024698 [Rhipicephalus microplus]|uniref:Peptidase M13 C-terminal domain-containing protein n=1 Tax=Rhipicephalus microplus TaxID=6941 RepID=A0A9J6E5B5_RHIMP|nr:hypothetical protein HPB51_024698 [Rhipicephalus microplus]